MTAKHFIFPSWPLLAILGLALALRLWGISDRLPDPTLGIRLVDDSAVEETDRTTMERAWAMWHGGAGQIDLNPHTAGWPGLPFYATLGIQVIYAGIYGLVMGGGDFLTFARRYPANAPGLYLFARLFSVVLGALSVYLAYRLATRISSGFVGLSAGFLLAVNPLHALTSQHVSDPNLLALLFTLLATNSLLDVWERQRTRDSILSGAFIGLAVASKYLPIVLLVPFVYAHARRSVGGVRPTRSAVMRIVAGLGVCIAVFLVASPYSVLDWSTMVQDLAGQRESLLSPWAGQTEGIIALPTYLTRTLPDILSWPGYALAIMGLALLLLSGRPQGIVASIPIVLLLANGMLSVAQGRYVLPAVPFLLIGTAFAIEWGWHRIRTRMPSLRSAALPTVVILSCALAPIKSMAEGRESMRRADSRRLARQWMQASIDPAEPVALDLYGPVVNSERQERLAIIWPLRVSGSSRVQAAYHAEWLDGLRYYVASSEVSRRFDAKMPESRFYSWIRGHSKQVWQSDPAHESGPEIAVYMLPPSISSPVERDSVWAAVPRGEINTDRLARWTTDMATLFLYSREWGRVEEWSMRGLTLGQTSQEEHLLANLAFARLQVGRNAEAEHSAGEALLRYPNNYQLHLYRGMALDGMGQRGNAIVEYRKSLSILPGQEGHQDIESRIHVLEEK